MPSNISDRTLSPLIPPSRVTNRTWHFVTMQKQGFTVMIMVETRAAQGVESVTYQHLGSSSFTNPNSEKRPWLYRLPPSLWFWPFPNLGLSVNRSLGGNNLYLKGIAEKSILAVLTWLTNEELITWQNRHGSTSKNPTLFKDAKHLKPKRLFNLQLNILALVLYLTPPSQSVSEIFSLIWLSIQQLAQLINWYGNAGIQYPESLQYIFITFKAA